MKPKPFEVVKQKFVKIENDFFPIEMPFEKRTELLVHIGNKAKNDYENEFGNLVSYFKKYDSLYLCSFASFYFNRQVLGVDEEAINGCLDFYPFYLEILQCVSLMQRRNISGKPLNEDIVKFKNTIKNLNLSQSHSYLKFADKAKDETDIGKIMLRSEMMTHTLAVRNWAYIHQMESIAFELADLVTEKFIDIHGFNPKNLLYILFRLVSFIEEKQNAHIKKMVVLFKSKNLNEAFDRYEELFEDLKHTSISQRNELWVKYKKDINNLKSLLLAHSDLFLSKIYTFSSCDVFNLFSDKVSEKEIYTILNKLSFSFGSLSDINKDHIFLDNPIHSRPLIKLDESNFFSIIPHLFTHLGVDLLEGFISEDKNLHNEYALRKGKLLESKVELLFRESFPTAKILSGSLWYCPIERKLFENDLIVLIEEFVLIVECKSGTVSPPARRGAIDRLFKTLQELVVAPSEQAIRFLNYLVQHPEIHEFQTKSGITNIVDTTTKKYYIPLGITLSNLGSIGCNLKKLIDANVVSHKIVELAPSISITDLEIIFELLPLACEKIHYLSRRREFEAHLSFQGDEMDLFCFYLENGFNIGESEYDTSMHINLTLKSKEIDPYFIGKYRGVYVNKPILQKTKYWQDILKKIDNKGSYWLQSSYILLNLPKEDQRKFEKSLEKLKSTIIKGKCEKIYKCMVMEYGPKRRQYVLVGFPYKNIDIEERNRLINNLIVSFEENNDLRGFLILGYDLESMDYPYSVMAGGLKTNFFDNLELDKETN